MYYIDYHIHTLYSADCKSELEDICNAAIQLEIKEIALTDHYDPYKEDPFCTLTYDYIAIQNSIEYLKEKYAGKLKILLGVESGQTHLYPNSTKKLLSNDFDYVIGSLHNITGDIDLALMSYTKTSDDIFEQYFNELLIFAKSGLYDCIGHLDYPKRYAYLYGYSFNPNKFYDILRQILKTIIHLGKGIEVNCSGLRQRVNQQLPGAMIIKMFKELGGEIITIGSDAHNPSQVGAQIKKGMDIISECGFDYITTFEKRKTKFIKI